MLLLNAFSANMLAAFPTKVAFEPISVEEAASIAADGIDSAVGHADTAALFSSQLGVSVLVERRTVSLAAGAVALVGQYRGPRLDEGATQLPEGAEIIWLRMTVS